ncbi:unnamed protein product, partial [Symbiodinium sp. CCMP2456]
GTNSAFKACESKLLYQAEAWTSKPSLRSDVSCTVKAVCGYDYDWLEPNQCLITDGTDFVQGS